MRRFGYELSFLVDEDAKSHVGLDLLGVKRRRIPEGKLLVEHHRKDIGTRPDSGKRVTRLAVLAAR